MRVSSKLDMLVGRSTQGFSMTRLSKTQYDRRIFVAMSIYIVLVTICSSPGRKPVHPSW